MNFTIGADPERFCKRGNVIICPNEIIPMPKLVIPCGDYGGMNRDGMALELNPAPHTNIRIVAENIYRLLEDAIYEAGQIGAEIADSIKTSVESFDGLPDDVRTIGCEPDFNAYTMDWNRLSEEQLKMKERYAGGHIHIGMLGNMNFARACELVKGFDGHTGLISILWSTPESVERRLQYGKAGAFRFNTNKGIVEYRVPDANWTMKRGRFEILADSMTKVAQELLTVGVLKKVIPEDEVVGVINSCNVQEARKMLDKLGYGGID